MKLITLVATTLLSASVFATEVVDIPASKPVEQGWIDFGSVPQNSSRTQVLTLTNNSSDKVLTDISAKISGDFSMKNKCPKTLQPGESCQAKIYFWATHFGGHYGRLNVTTSEKDYHYELYGYGERDPFGNIPNPPIPQPPRP